MGIASVRARYRFFVGSQGVGAEPWFDCENRLFSVEVLLQSLGAEEVCKAESPVEIIELRLPRVGLARH